MKGIDRRSGFVAGRARRTGLAVVSAMLMAFSLMATAAPAGGDDHPEKVTICHAAGREGTTHYETLTISENAVYGRHGNAGHFEENGTQRAGHEQDYFGECKPELNSASLTVIKRVRSTETEVPATRFPFAMDADGERDSFVLAAGDSKTFDFEFDSDRFDVTVGELVGELSEGFSFVSASCASGDRVVEYGNRASVSLPDGADVTCTFLNRYDEPSEDVPSVKVVKEVLGDEGASATEFAIKASTPDRQITMTFVDGGSHTFLPPAGTVNFGIAELEITERNGHWTTEISCLSDVRPPFGSSSSSLVIDEIGEGEDIVCTVINTYDDGEDGSSGGGGTTAVTQPQIETPCFDGTAEDVFGKCVKPEPPEAEVEVLGIQIEATTTSVEAVTTDTLPFTGDDSSGILIAGLLVLAAGALLLGGSSLESVSIRGGRHARHRLVGRWNSN